MIINGNSLDVLKTLDENSVDSIVCDPPYGLKFMSKAWDYDVPQVELWKEAIRVLKPGGYLLAFAGTRTQHRMAVNIEDAGFEIRDMIAWIYGSGFPKSHNIGKAVDKIQGNEREVTGEREVPDIRGDAYGTMNDKQGGSYNSLKIQDTKGSSPYEGWGTALKPSHEDITLAQKPLEHRTDTEYNRDICQTLLALIVANSSTLNLAEPSEGLSIAQWTAEKNINTLDDLREVMAILQLSKTENISLNTVLSWLNILAENWLAKNTSTISTKLNTITELKILHSLEWESILRSITQAKDKQTDGFSVDAYNAISLLNALELKLKHTLEHSADESATYLAGLADLRPKLDPIVMARKPFKGTVAQNILEWGTGGINIDGSRVETTDTYHYDRKGGNTGAVSWQGLNVEVSADSNPQGRFPANLITDGSDEVVGLFPDVKGSIGRANRKSAGDYNATNYKVGVVTETEFKDSGSAARFFYCAKASKSERNKGLEGFEDVLGGSLEGGNDKRNGDTPQLKPTKNGHPTVKPVKLMQYLVKLVTPPQVTDCIDCGTVLQYLYGTTDNKLPMVQTRFSEERKTQENSQVLRKDMRSKMVGTKQKDHKGLDDNKQGLQNADGQRTPQSEQIRLRTGTSASDGKRNRQVSDTTGDSPPQELEQDRQPTREPRSFRQDNTRQATEATNQADRMSSLPSSYKVIGTCKKCNGTLVSRPGICLDPFNGSGTTGIACKLEGFEYIGIELDPEYVKLSEARIEAWTPDEEQLELV